MKNDRSILTMPIRVLLLVLLFTIGCGKGFTPSEYANLDSDDSGSHSDDGDDNDGGNPKPELSICSKLDFSLINWPTYFSVGTQNGFALALNITGSFEGHQAWNTMAGDSDKQGISLGLLQQNLGQGTLQPLLAAMKKHHSTTMKPLFTPAHWTSLSTMLDEWTRTNPVTAPPVLLPMPGPALASLTKRSLASTTEFAILDSTPLIYPDDAVLSPLDINAEEELDGNFKLQALATTAVTKTLTWARQNVLSGTAVKADWKKEFQTLANTPIYRNFQFLEAASLHMKTERLREFFGFETLTGYLFLFDIVVQNGSGLHASTVTAYNDYIKKNPNATEVQRMRKFLEIRLLRVNPKYVNDVNSRKSAIINGTGTVHGSQRNLPREYCYQGQIAIDPL